MDVIDYAVQSRKVSEQNDNSEIFRNFVSGINCTPAIARNEMMAVKAKFGKESGTAAYHGYQSFAPGEVSPETAHKIGVKLAEKLWGRG